MRRNPWSVLVAVVGVFALVVGMEPVGAQGRPEGKITRSYREAQSNGRPEWVGNALARSMAHLKANGQAYGLRDAEAELALRGADEDDLGQTHVRLDQRKDGVPVFGGQLLTHLDSNRPLC